MVQALFGLAIIAHGAEPTLMPLGPAWSANSVNAVVFRNDPISSDSKRQYAAYYNADGRVVIASRELGKAEWTSTVTNLRGNVKDAHNAISIIVDGAGYLHVSWDHHDQPLHYVRSDAPGSIEFTDPMPMTGKHEDRLSYPQFFKLPDGNLLFFYRDGGSGRGNLVLNRYDVTTQTWTQLQDNLIDGQGHRNAYWEATVDGRGTIHLAWVWRESPNVASNHDICYARSSDGGKTWQRSDGKRYALPINVATAEIAAAVPQKHELINQTSICADDDGRPIIATYFRDKTGIVQYQLIVNNGAKWTNHQVSHRKTSFSLEGGGSKQIPISRPQVLAATRDGKTKVWMVFRDIERDARVSVSQCDDLSQPKWMFRDLTSFSVKSWEPSFDRARWQRDGVLDLYVQVVGQGDGETLEEIEPQPAQVLEWTP